jgi:inhibitor of KinA
VGWIVDAVPAYDTLTVVYDPVRLAGEAAVGEDAVLPYDLAAAEVKRLLSGRIREETSGTRIIELPVCYGEGFGPDLAEAARRTGLSEDEFVRRHAEAEYTVVMIGFLPGFPYLTGLPPELAQPRKTSPRLRVPAGSVGIAGGQTGVYPFATPGGWQLIGLTTVRLFDPFRLEPSLLKAGDRLKFVPVEPEQMKAWREER